jgi:MFS family permease
MLVFGKAFGGLYLSAALLQFGATLLISHLALRLGAHGASEFWIGALMAANALGMVVAGFASLAFIERIGHVRAFAAGTAALVTVVLAHEIGATLSFWLVLRAFAGAAMMIQLITLESWLNDQANGQQRGQVLAGYMIATYIGMMLGQLGVVADGAGSAGLIVVAGAVACCAVPLAMTRLPRPDARAQVQATFLRIVRRVPRQLTTVFVSGMLNSSFFGLAAIYAKQAGMSPGAAAIYLACPVVAGLLAQFPLGMLSDRLPRPMLVRSMAILLAVASVALATGQYMPLPASLLLACCIGALQFCFYPLGAAWANSEAEPAMRVGLAGVLLTTFGLGSCLGPLIAGAWMSNAGESSLYWFYAACTASLAAAIGKERRMAAPAHSGMPIHDKS